MSKFERVSILFAILPLFCRPVLQTKQNLHNIVLSVKQYLFTENIQKELEYKIGGKKVKIRAVPVWEWLLGNS